ncbi:hypothetical protein [Actinosynnema mirum]|uniref:Uncharacterized protein n=1 Tax=Actinosynnema mirum (strain ATCC 29888 / DSM 43827 / JCM 3225 / NBRC 14064 / NCIMB 13271 / NRRL B-12336 / IMRU 3971 / 101) TaxID=446462 RepID=C6WB97_ACTMD|nr:hypothetical protein [Actinosynnema mirum]ACU39388.1 hypothetical protein Amir_5570 [Actinosynnema mirum DSM 43827]
MFRITITITDPQTGEQHVEHVGNVSSASVAEVKEDLPLVAEMIREHVRGWTGLDADRELPRATS